MNYEAISPKIFHLLINEIIAKHVILLRAMPTNEEIEDWNLDKYDQADFINAVGHFNKMIKIYNQKSIEYLDTIKH